MEVLIITDDSGEKLPTFNKWRAKWSHGIDIRKYPPIKSQLNAYNVEYPTDDIENESAYKTLLNEFVRPAIEMFSGRFSEIRRFSQILSSFIPTKIYIISGRYGLITENDEIIPYHFQLKTPEDVKLLDEKFDVRSQIRKLEDNQKIFLFVLPFQYIEYLIEKKFFTEFSSNTPIILIARNDFKKNLSEFPNVTFLNRIGIARMGNQNRELILNLIKVIQENRN